MTDEELILELFEDGDRAIMAADEGELRRIYADDYVQYDETGREIRKDEMMHELTSGKARYVSMKSTGRTIRLLREGIATVHGSEEDEIEQDGRRSTVRYVYMDVVEKRGGRWQIVASQLAKP